MTETPDPAPSPPRVQRFFERLGDLQADSPWRIVLAAALVAAVSVPFVLRLELRGDLTALLPEHAPAVEDLDAITDRMGRATTLTVAVHGESREDVRAFARALAQDLERDLPEHALSLDWDASAMETFVEDHKYLFADLGELREIRDALQERKEYEVAQSNPFMIQLDDEEPPSFDSLVDRLRNREHEAEEYRSAVNHAGYFEHPDIPLVAIFIRTDVRIGEAAEGRALANEVEARARRIQRETGLAGVQWDLGSDLMDSVEEAEALIGEVALATSIAIVLVLGSVYLFFLSNRSIPLLGLSLVPPVLLTFAFAQLTVEYLNSSSAFLGSIVVGNGVNPNVIWLARYFEERREGTGVHDAIRRSHLGTWKATLTASLAAALAYASLAITDFRGFRDFGIIGGFGMVACWIGCILVLPALSALVERVRPVRRREAARRNIYGVIFRYLALKAPRLVVALAALLTVVSAWEVYQYVAADPMEYDFRKLQSERDPSSRVKWVNDRQGEIVGESTTGSAMAMFVPRREDVTGVVAELRAIQARRPGYIGEIHSIDDVLPTDQAEKIETLAGIRELLLDLRRYADDAQQHDIDRYVPPADITEVHDADLPETAARAFTETNGTVGRIVYIGHDPSGNVWDGKFMLKWAGAVRRVRLADGSRPPVTGSAVVFADLLEAIFTDAPKAVAVALILTTLLVIVAFRRWRDRFYTIAALVVGVLWMTASLAVFRIKLNFLNFLAFPITFGNGVDYAVNYMQRQVEEERSGGDAVRRSVEATGGAVVLCSLTTVHGYISLYASSNQALNSFGAAMAFSELMCVAAAIVALPALLSLRAKRAAARAAAGRTETTTSEA